MENKSEKLINAQQITNFFLSMQVFKKLSFKKQKISLHMLYLY